MIMVNSCEDTLHCMQKCDSERRNAKPCTTNTTNLNNGGVGGGGGGGGQTSYSLTSNQQIRQMIASAIGSISATICLNPLNVIKVRFQNNVDSKSVSQIVRGVHQSDGFRGFFSGLRIGVFQSLPGTVIYMSTYEWIKGRLLTELEGKYAEYIPGVAAGLSRIVSVSAVSPIEFIRTLQSGGHLGSTLSISRDIWKNRGILGFYRGWGATIFRDAPYSTIYWLCFERFRPIFENKLYSIDRGGGSNRSNYNSNSSSSSSSSSSNDNISNNNSSSDNRSSSIYSNSTSNRYYASTNFICGALSGAFAALITHPMDVIKTKQQLMAEDKPKMPFIERLRHSIKKSGFFSLYKGLALRLAIVIPSGAIMVTVYEAAKHFEV